MIEQGKLDLVHVQADEIRIKGRSMIAWMGLALMVSTRLWLGGAVSLTRDKRLADQLLRAAARLCASGVCRVGLYGWLGRLCGQQQASVS